MFQKEDTVMTRSTMHAMSHMSHSASAYQAEASCSCAHHAAYNGISLILDAIIMASIIICVLICGIGILALAITLLVLVLVLGLLVRNRFDFHTPEMRRRALL